MIEWFKLGGFFMWPILICSIWAVTLLVERAWYYVALKKKIAQQAGLHFSASRAQGVNSAYQNLQGQQGVLPDILRAAWNPEHGSASLAERSVEEELHKHKPELERSLSTLATLASVQPLLGLLGTISGMIATFSVIASQGTGDSRALADGISEAMITTQAGLCVALPILLGHNYLRNRYRNILSSLQQHCARALKEKEQHVAP